MVKRENKGMRVDKLLAVLDETVSRSKWKTAINTGQVTVNDEQVKPSYTVNPGDEIEVRKPQSLQPPRLEPEKGPLDVVYEDDQVLGINKANSTVVHPGPGNWHGTLANALAYYYDDLPSPEDELRPGIVHRLDKETSGILIVARTEMAYYDLASQFRKRRVDKDYLAVVEGGFSERRGMIDAPIGRDPKNPTRMTVKFGGKESRTEFLVVEEFEDSTLLRVKPRTGRTHQIRVHLKYIGHEIIGDMRYGGRESSRLMLHAREITFTHPKKKTELTLKSPIPTEFPEVSGGG